MLTAERKPPQNQTSSPPPSGEPWFGSRLAEMQDALHHKGVAITRKRAKLLEVLLSSDRHPSAAEIHQGVRAFYPETSLATIYNTLDILKETGQVLEIEFSASANRYDGRIPASHPHLICVKCEKVEDMDDDQDAAPAPSDPLARVSQATGYHITRLRADYYGTCPDCLSASPANAAAPNRAAQERGFA